MKKLLSTPVISQEFPIDTVEAPFVFTVTGTLPDGSNFTNTEVSEAPSMSMELPVGTGFTVIVSKLGYTSAPSAPIDIVMPVMVKFSVPDSTQPAVLS